MTWCPHVTVAAVIEQDGKFLVVREKDGKDIVYNQPAGHLEAGESLIDAVIREVQEETAWQFMPESIVGIYRMHVDAKDITYLRICFSGTVNKHNPAQPLDDGILEAVWLGRDELFTQEKALRSPLVLQCIDDYLAGKQYGMELLMDIGNV